MQKWLTIIGIGDDGFNGLNAYNQQICYAAEIILAPERILKSAPKFKAETHIWGSPLHKSVEKILSWRNRKSVVVLATGDPMHYGIGATLARKISINEMAIYPSASAFSLAAARLGWNLAKTQCISLHGRNLSLMNKALQHNSLIISLTSNSKTVDDVVELLIKRGFGKSELSVLEHIGGANERILNCIANDWKNTKAADFNVVAIKTIADNSTAIIPNIAGLDDTHYIHDGQLTKSDIRAATLNKLLPTRNSIMWDLGAGAGSVGIEYMRLATGSITHAVEHNLKRLNTIQMNAYNLGVQNIQTYPNKSLDIIDGLPTPDAVFIGGGLSEELFNKAYSRLAINGRLVVNAVTLQANQCLAKIYMQLNQKAVMCQFTTSTLKPIGKLQVFKPNLPITQLSLIKAIDL